MDHRLFWCVCAVTASSINNPLPPIHTTTHPPPKNKTNNRPRTPLAPGQQLTYAFRLRLPARLIPSYNRGKRVKQNPTHNRSYGCICDVCICVCLYTFMHCILCIHVCVSGCPVCLIPLVQPRCVPSTPHFARLVWWWAGHADCHARLIFVGAGRRAQYVQWTCISILSNHTPPNPTHPIQNTHTTQAPAPASSTWRQCRWAGGSVTRTSPSPCWRRASWVGGVFVICICIWVCV